MSSHVFGFYFMSTYVFVLRKMYCCEDVFRFCWTAKPECERCRTYECVVRFTARMHTSLCKGKLRGHACTWCEEYSWVNKLLLQWFVQISKSLNLHLWTFDLNGGPVAIYDLAVQRLLTIYFEKGQFRRLKTFKKKVSFSSTLTQVLVSKLVFGLVGMPNWVGRPKLPVL